MIAFPIICAVVFCVLLIIALTPALTIYTIGMTFFWLMDKLDGDKTSWWCYVTLEDGEVK